MTVELCSRGIKITWWNINSIFEGFISFWYNDLGPVLEEIILIEMLTEVLIILEKACVTLSMGASELQSKELVE